MFAASDPWRRLGVTLEKCREMCGDPDYRVFVARARGEKCGVMVLQRRGVAGAPYIKSIAVSEARRSRGIGRLMVQFAEGLFRPESKHLFLCVSSFNRRARAFYERLGYQQVGEFENYIIDGESEVLMHKRLA